MVRIIKGVAALAIVAVVLFLMDVMQDSTERGCIIYSPIGGCSAR